MAMKNWTVLDVTTQTCIDQLTLGPDDVGGSAKNYSVEKRRLRGGLNEGVDEILVSQGDFTVSLLPTRGMGIWRAWYGNEEIGWKSPVRGPVHPQFVDVGEPGGLGWLDGFDELLVRCGLESNGAPEFDEKTGQLKYPLHGRIANRPAHEVHIGIDGDTGKIMVRGVVEETRFHFLKFRMTTEALIAPGEPIIKVSDTIENLSASPAEAQMLYHVNFGVPLLDAGSRVVAAAKTVVPRTPHAAASVKTWDSYRAEQAGFEEEVYFLNLHGDSKGDTQVMLKNAHSTRGVSLHFNTGVLPCFSLWKNTTAAADGCVTGLEPGTNYPNPRSFEGKQGRIIKLPPRGKTTLSVSLEWHPDEASVQKAEAAISNLQAEPPKIFDKPQPGWCA